MTPQQIRLIDIVSSEIYKEVDGFFVYAPNEKGFLTPDNLRTIADHLDSLNADWERDIEDDQPSSLTDCGMMNKNSGNDW